MRVLPTSDPISSAARAPRSVSIFNPISKFLLAAGVPLGPNGLITIRGRKSGLPRTTPVAIIEVSGRRWIWAPWGEVNWVRNLRAAGRATITVRCREEIRATALDQTQRFAFFAVVLGPLARRTPFGLQFIRIADGVDLNHPVEVARDRRVFELHAICSNASSHDANVGRGERRCEYLRDFSRIVKEREIAAVIVAAMLDLHEDRDNSRTLWHSAALPSPSARAVCQRATAGSSR